MGPRKSKKKTTSPSNVQSDADEFIQPVSSANNISRNLPRVQQNQIHEGVTQGPTPDAAPYSNVEEQMPNTSSQVKSINPILPDIINTSISQLFSLASGRSDPLSQPNPTGILTVAEGVEVDISHPTLTSSSYSAAIRSLDSSLEGLVLRSDDHSDPANSDISSQDHTLVVAGPQGEGIKKIVKENFVYYFESNSTSNCLMLVINELPKAFKDRYDFNKLPIKFLVRKCYVELYEVAKEIMIRDIGRSPAVLFTGTPGIGKSVFLLYFVCRYLSEATRPENKRFALETGSGIYQYFSPTGIENEFMYLKNVKEDSYQDESVFPLREVLVLTDIAENAPPGRPRGKWKFLFCSPNPERYKQYMKDKPRYKYYLPTWTKEELLMFNPNESTWIRWYNMFGGIPLYVFDENKGYILDTMLGALEIKGPGTARNFFARGFLSSLDSNMSYCLVHINPMPEADAAVAANDEYGDEYYDEYGDDDDDAAAGDDEDDDVGDDDEHDDTGGDDAAGDDDVAGDDDDDDDDSSNYEVDDGQVSYSMCVYSIASGYVFEKLVRIDRQQILVTAKKLFNSGGNAASRIYGSTTAGIYFEKLCLWLDPIAKTIVTATRLAQRSEPLTFTLPSKKILAKDWKSAKNLSADVLYQPDLTNLESGDAFCVTNIGSKKCLVVLQFTVAEKHPVKMNGLNAIENAFPSSVKFHSKILLFVTPAHGKLKSVQNIVTQKNSKCKNTKASETFQQYVYRHKFKVGPTI